MHATMHSPCMYATIYDSACVCQLVISHAYDRYTWEGTGMLQQTIEHLRHVDLSQPYAPGPAPAKRVAEKPSQLQHAGVAPCMLERKERSLGLLAQRFIQMLLSATQDESAVALDEAAKSLLGRLLFLLLIAIALLVHLILLYVVLLHLMLTDVLAAVYVGCSDAQTRSVRATLLSFLLKHLPGECHTKWQQTCIKLVRYEKHKLAHLRHALSIRAA